METVSCRTLILGCWQEVLSSHQCQCAKHVGIDTDADACAESEPDAKGVATAAIIVAAAAEIVARASAHADDSFFASRSGEERGDADAAATQV